MDLLQRQAADFVTWQQLSRAATTAPRMERRAGQAGNMARASSKAPTDLLARASSE